MGRFLINHPKHQVETKWGPLELIYCNPEMVRVRCIDKPHACRCGLSIHEGRATGSQPIKINGVGYYLSMTLKRHERDEWTAAHRVGDCDLYRSQRSTINGHRCGVTFAAIKVAREEIPRPIAAWLDTHPEWLEEGAAAKLNNELATLEGAVLAAEEAVDNARARLFEADPHALRLCLYSGRPMYACNGGGLDDYFDAHDCVTSGVDDAKGTK